METEMETEMERKMGMSERGISMKVIMMIGGVMGTIILVLATTLFAQMGTSDQTMFEMLGNRVTVLREAHTKDVETFRSSLDKIQTENRLMCDSIRKEQSSQMKVISTQLIELATNQGKMQGQLEVIIKVKEKP